MSPSLRARYTQAQIEAAIERALDDLETEDELHDLFAQAYASPYVTRTPQPSPTSNEGSPYGEALYEAAINMTCERGVRFVEDELHDDSPNQAAPSQHARYENASYDAAVNDAAAYDDAPYEDAPYEDAPYEDAYEDAPYEEAWYEIESSQSRDFESTSFAKDAKPPTTDAVVEQFFADGDALSKEHRREVEANARREGFVTVKTSWWRRMWPRRRAVRYA